MGISSITRDWGVDPSIVRIVTSDALSVVGQIGYIATQEENIELANNGDFQWLPSDSVLVYAADGSAFFRISIDFNSLLSLAGLVFTSPVITPTAFNGMYAAPILLIPPQGANQLIIVNSMQLIETFNSAAYAGGGVVAAQYDNTVHGAGVLATNSEAAADFFATASTTYNFITAQGALPFSSTVNKGIYLSNATGAFTTGDSPFVAKLNYNVIAVV